MEFLVLILILAIWLIIAHFTGTIAEQKGYSYYGFAFFSLFVPLIALLIAGLLQSKYAYRAR